MHIVMTGATTGIGLEAAMAMMETVRADLVVGARAPESAPAELTAVATLLEVDLASLAEVRAFADEVARGRPIDVLLLNAGLQCKGYKTSADGFELTFAVNHLAHYLLARLLVPRLALNARVVFTSSGTHDPEEHTPIPTPLHADAQRLARPKTDPQRDANAGKAARRAYSTSKLCNVMTARELARRLAETRPDVAVAAFDPGFTPDTGLARDHGPVVAWVIRNVVPLVVRGGRVSTPEVSGRLLADLATSPDYASARGSYHAVRGGVLIEQPPSTLARDDAAAAKLWDDSAALVGLEP